MGRERERENRQQLCVTVPSLFRCPISLDVMRSPVSLSTGVTYDRSSIQHWLDSGHDTCPATMQVLTSKDLVPNLTLHRLITVWCSQAAAAASAAARSSGESSPAVTEEQVKVIMEKIRGKEEDEGEGISDLLLKIVQFLSYGEENRGFFTRFDFVEVIVGVLNREKVEIEVLEVAIRVLDLILNEEAIKERLNKSLLKNEDNNNDKLSSFVSILQKGKLKSKIEAIHVLNSMAVDTESKRRLAESDNLLSVLTHLLHSSNPLNFAMSDAVLTFLITITTGTTRSSVKTELIRLGFVQLLSSMLHTGSSKNDVEVHEKSLKLLSIICSFSEGRLAISLEPKCVEGVVERLMKVSKTAKEDAVLVLWSVCWVLKDARVKEAVVKCNGLTKLLLVMQSEKEGSRVRKMCADLVKVLRVGCKVEEMEMVLGRYQTHTTHIMPC